MADLGFTIEEDLKPLGVLLNIPAFLEGRNRLSEGEVKVHSVCPHSCRSCNTENKTF